MRDTSDMSTLDGLNLNFTRPKRETRPPTKKRITFDGKDTTPKNQQRQSDVKSENKDDKKSKTAKTQTQQALAPLDDDADNQGFTEWLRSVDGVDTMRLFVIANSLVVFITMAWPHLQQSFNIIRELIFGEEE